MFKKKYYYGDGNDNIVRLTDIQARIVNKYNDPNRYRVNNGTVACYFDSMKEARIHSKAVGILNEYLKTHTVFHKDPSTPVLRKVK